MADAQHFNMTIITHSLESGDQDAISETLRRYADVSFPHEMYLQYKTAKLITSRAPDNEEAKQLLAKVEEEARQWKQFRAIYQSVVKKVTDENIAQIVPYLESEHALKVKYALEALSVRNVYYRHIKAHRLMEKVDALDQNDANVKAMQEKIRDGVQDHIAINEFMADIDKICRANGSTIFEAHATNQWHLFQDNSPEGIARQQAEEKELMELCFGPQEVAAERPVPRSARRPEVTRTGSFALVRTKRSERFDFSSEEGSSTSTEPNSKLQKCESMDVFGED